MFKLKRFIIQITTFIICSQHLFVTCVIQHTIAANNNNLTSNNVDSNSDIQIIEGNDTTDFNSGTNRTCEEFCTTHSLNKLDVDLVLSGSIKNIIDTDTKDDNINDIDLIINNMLNRNIELNKNYKNLLIEEFLKKSSFIFGLTKTVNENYVSQPCYNQLQEIKKAILHKDIWGIKVLDASGIKKSGFLWGNNFWFGSKEGCEAVQNPVDITLSNQIKRTMKMGLIGDLAPFEMEYRIIYIKHNSPWQVQNKVQTEGIIHVGLCIPKSCSNSEIYNITQNYLDQGFYTESNLYEMNPQIIKVKNLKVDDSFFNKKSIKLLSSFILFTILMFIFSGLLNETVTEATITIQNEKLSEKEQKTNFGSFEMRKKNCNSIIINTESSNSINSNNELQIDIKNQKLSIDKLKDLSSFRKILDESDVYKFIKCFDFVNNWNTLFFTESQTASSIPIINGIRSISCVWIICFHVVWYMWFTIEDQTFLVSIAEKFVFQYLSSAPLLVDVFFTISGFLLAYKFFKNQREMSSIKQNSFGTNIKIFINKIFHRYLRLAPPSFVVIGIVEIFSAYSENVSIFHLHERNDQTCSKYWWRNFLFIQNFFNLDDMCLNWTWSLACEMQFFIVTLLLLFIYCKNPTKAKNIFLLGFITTIIWTFVAGYRYQYQLSFDIAYNTRTHIYINPFLRILPYYIGVGTGWYLGTNKGDFEMTQTFEKRSWYLSLVVFFVAMHSTIKRDMGFLGTVTLIVIGRILFALSLCWMIIGSATGRGVWWSRILEYQLFQHLNKLSYSMYLVNPLVIFIIFNLSSSTTHTNPIMMAVVTTGVIVIVYVLSIFFSITFEMPYCNLSTFIFRKKKKII